MVSPAPFIADEQIAHLVEAELKRQRSTIELIASENFVSRDVMRVAGSVLTNKYAEGYPGHRYYGGCEEVDKIENIACERACSLFDAKYANVQAHSGTQSNWAAYAALAEPGETIMGLDLSNGGHLSHGYTANFSGKIYKSVSYHVGEDEFFDYEAILKLAKECRPKIIIAGASAYPRIIDFKRFSEIAHEVGAYLVADIAHIAGLVATGAHPSPVPWADVVTSTTHKTLRGPRGGLILCNDETIAKKINSAVFPGGQGGPCMHIIAAKAVALREAATDQFKHYIDQVIENCAAMGQGMSEGGLRLVSGGTDNHLCLADLMPANVTGRDAEKILERIGLTANKNTIPKETLSPFVASGLRVGSAAGTSRGLSKDDFLQIGLAIAKSLFSHDNESILDELADKMHAIGDAHPLYEELRYC